MEIVKKSIVELGKIKLPKMFGIPTGVRGLDELFELKGFPSHSVFNIVGPAGSGKSLIAEQFAIKQASMGYHVAYVTFGSPADFLAIGIKKKAKNFDEIKDKIVIIDGASNSRLRKSIKILLNTLAYIIKKYKIKSTVIDPIDGLFELNQNSKVVVRELFNFMKKWYQNAIFTSRKSYFADDIPDGMIILSKKIIQSIEEEKIYRRKIGEVVRTIRIDSCRLSGHDVDEHMLYIKNGEVLVGSSIKKVLNEER